MSRAHPELPTAIDLFCGAGGLTAALEVAGFHTVAAVDHDRDAISTLMATQTKKIQISGTSRVHLEGAKLICSDIAGISRADLVPEGADPSWRPDILAGGPPCQPFSSAGRQLGLDDPRGRLFLDFVRLASELQPRFILFENVAGLVTAKDRNGVPGGVLQLVQEAFEEIGYVCRFSLLNAADFGAPQRRVRLFMIASASQVLPQFPEATHSRDGRAVGLKQWVSLGEFLKKLPKPNPVDIVRPDGKRAEALRALIPGTGLKSIGIVEANRPSGHWGYRQDSFLADLSMPARTIRAASSPDWVRIGRADMRRLTWKECAALQGFPDGWSFEGTIAARFRQIGNAVQGAVGAAIGRVLASNTDSAHEIVNASAPWPSVFEKRVRYTHMEHITNGDHRLAAKAQVQEQKAGYGRPQSDEMVRRRA